MRNVARASVVSENSSTTGGAWHPDSQNRREDFGVGGSESACLASSRGAPSEKCVSRRGARGVWNSKLITQNSTLLSLGPWLVGGMVGSFESGMSGIEALTEVSPNVIFYAVLT